MIYCTAIQRCNVILLPHSVPGFSPAAAVHGGFSFGGLNPSNPAFSRSNNLYHRKNYFH
jgi:hypothetical protein